MHFAHRYLWLDARSQFALPAESKAACSRTAETARADDFAPDAPAQPEAVAADAAYARLVVVGRAEPGAHNGDDAGGIGGGQSTDDLCPPFLVAQRSAASCQRMCGKPRKLAVLANFAPPVSIRLSQPARMVKVSSSVIARTDASSRVSTAMPSVTSWPKNLGAPSRVRAACPVQHAEGEPTGSETAAARGGEGPVAQEIDHGTGALKGGIFDIHFAARIAERSIAGSLEGPPDRLAKYMGERAHLRHEGQPPAPDLAHGAAPHHHALARMGPVQAPDLDLGVVPAAVGDVCLADSIRGQRAVGVLRIDRQVGPRANLGGRQAALRLERRPVEAQHPVVVGEAEGNPVGPGDPPATSERGRAVIEMDLQGGREGGIPFSGPVYRSPQQRWLGIRLAA